MNFLMMPTPMTTTLHSDVGESFVVVGVVGVCEGGIGGLAADGVVGEIPGNFGRDPFLRRGREGLALASKATAEGVRVSKAAVDGDFCNNPEIELDKEGELFIVNFAIKFACNI